MFRYYFHKPKVTKKYEKWELIIIVPSNLREVNNFRINRILRIFTLNLALPQFFGEISYSVINKKNNNDKELGLILTGNFIEKGVIDKNMSLKYM